MDDKPSTSTKDNFLGTPLGILLAIIFFPFFFTWWVYKKNWNPRIKWAFMLGFWSLILIAEITNYPQKNAVSTRQKDIIAVTPQPVSEISISGTPPSLTITYPPFDKNRGNNYISAKYAQQYMDFANKMAPGAIQNVYLELSPADPDGKTDSFLTVTVNSFYWNTANDSTKKALVAACINELKNIFSGYPHLIVNNGTKTVATGELPSLSGDPVVTLK